MIGPAHEPPPLLALALSGLRHGVQGAAPGRLRRTQDRRRPGDAAAGHRQASRVPARVPALAVAASLRHRRLLSARADGRRPRDDRAAVHAVHHRPRAAQHRRSTRAARLARLHLAGAIVRRGHRRLEPDRRAQGLPPAAAERARDAVAAAVAVRPAAAPAAAEAVGHEDRRHPVAAHRRRRHDDRAAADGGRLAGGLGHPAGRSPSASC